VLPGVRVPTGSTATNDDAGGRLGRKKTLCFI
jgi:hypothetical protein